MKAHVEGYGCSLNRADTAAIKGCLLGEGFELSEENDADLLIINTCAVKEQTEYRMLNRIRKLYEGKTEKQTLVVFGCLPKISPKRISEISEEIVQLGPRLEELTKHLKIKTRTFDLSVREVPNNPYITIIPISRGCLMNCAFCCVKQARGPLKSYSPEAIEKRFAKAIKETPEIWLTAEDTGSYGKDIGSSLPKLLELLLKHKGDYRIRLGMMNPLFLESFYGDFKRLFADERIYKFLHLPLQSGSDKILDSMNRNYTAKQFLGLAERLRSDFPNLTLATDIIVGFPGETESDFRMTVNTIKKLKPCVANISRYGARPNTPAEKFPNQISGAVKKRRSKSLTELCRTISKNEKKKMQGNIERILVTEKGLAGKGNYVGRASNYVAVVIEENLLGIYADVEIRGAETNYVAGKLQQPF